MLTFAEVTGKRDMDKRGAEREERQGGEQRAGSCHSCCSHTNMPTWIAAHDTVQFSPLGSMILNSSSSAFAQVGCQTTFLRMHPQIYSWMRM